MYDADAFSITSSDLSMPSITVSVVGEVDIATATELTDYLDGVILAKPNRIVIDLSKVSYFDSSGIAALARVRQALADDASLTLRGVVPMVRKVLEVTGMDTILDIEDE